MTGDLELFEAFFQKSKPYYLDKLAKYKNGRKFSFNVFAFLFGLFWFLYRKMYLEAFVVAAVLFGEGLLEELILSDDISQLDSKIIDIVATIVVSTIVGGLANYFYLQKALKLVIIAKGKYSDKEQQEKFLTRKGGVSYIFIITIVVLIILLFAYNNFVTN